MTMGGTTMMARPVRHPGAFTLIELLVPSAIPTPMRIFLRASTPRGRVGRAPYHWAESDYIASGDVSTVNPFITSLPPPDPTFYGVMGLNVQRTFAAITDGTSNTLLFAED